MKIAIIGLGYVGLHLGLRFAESGVSVIGLDVDATKVDAAPGKKVAVKIQDATSFESFSPFTLASFRPILTCF